MGTINGFGISHNVLTATLRARSGLLHRRKTPSANSVDLDLDRLRIVRGPRKVNLPSAGISSHSSRNQIGDCPQPTRDSPRAALDRYEIFVTLSNNWSCLFAFYEPQYLENPTTGASWMRVISKARLQQFWESSENKDSEGPLRAWHTHVNHRSTAWHSWSDVKTSFGSASLVGNCVVFNIGGNNYRLVTRVLYPSQKVFILKVMTHAEYDESKWKTDCGCYEPPTQPSKSTDVTASTAQPRQRRN